jgi:hypothetical protein
MKAWASTCHVNVNHNAVSLPLALNLNFKHSCIQQLELES